MKRLLASAVLVAASTVMLAGCAAGGPDCEAINSEVRDISNGAQNTLASSQSPSDMSDYLSGLSDRIGTLEDQAGDGAAKTALEAFDQAITAASDFAATLPADPDAERDADGIAAQQASVSDAADAVKAACVVD